MKKIINEKFNTKYQKAFEELYTIPEILSKSLLITIVIWLIDYFNIFSKIAERKEFIFIGIIILILAVIKILGFKPWNLYKLTTVNYTDSFFVSSIIALFVYSIKIDICNKEQYYKTKFSTSKRYSFQSWTSSDSYIYLVKIFDDMLATGTGSSQNYIQDYFSVIEEDGQYRLNINGFVGKVEINKTGSNDNVTITVKDRIVYMDYSVYTISIKNDRQSTVLLDSRKKTDTTYIVDENNVKFESLLYENRDEDLKVASGETKQLQIKFSDSYREKIGIKQMVFEDVYLDDNFVYFGSNNGKIEVNLKE